MKCSLLSHESQNAFKFCLECNIFMCHQCFNHHKGLFNNHHLIDVTEGQEDIFIGRCKEENHNNKSLEYFCKSHNILCCSKCIETNNKHNSCDTCKIEDIKETKKENLEKNMKLLHDISINIKESINKAQKYHSAMEEQKEALKSQIMKMITNIRNKLNEREDELLSQIDSIYLNICPSEKAIKEYEKIPKKIKELLDKRDSLNKKLEDSFLLNYYIYDCINIEKESSKINEVYNSINKYNINEEKKIYFFPEENDINKIYDEIKSFGKIYQQIEEKKDLFLREIDKEIYELKKAKEKSENKNNELENIINDLKSQINNEKNKSNKIREELINSRIRFTMRSRCDLNKCLDTKNLSYGNSPHLWEYGHNNANQIFEIERNGDGTYSIKNSQSGLYLGVDPDRLAFRRRYENSQSFNVYHFDDGYYLFQEKCGAVVDLGDFHTNNGASIGKCHRNNSEAQQWKLVIHL